MRRRPRLLATVFLSSAVMMLPAVSRADPIEGDLLLHWDFEGETYDADTNQWTITDKSGNGHHTTAHGNYIQVTEDVAAESHVLAPASASNPIGVEVSSTALNSGFEDGLMIKARFSLDELPDGNGYIVRKGSSTNTVFALFMREGALRFSIADGTETTGSIITGGLAVSTIYEVTARFSPELDQISVTIDGGDYDNQTWTDEVTQNSLLVNTEPVTAFSNQFRGWMDDFQIVAVPEPGTLGLLGMIAAGALCRRSGRPY